MSAPYLWGDPTECINCQLCLMYCSIAKEGVLNIKKARIRIFRQEPQLDFPIACHHCDPPPPCQLVCPTEAIYRDGDTTKVNFDLCIGCAKCAEECPFGAIYFNPETEKALICDKCGACVPHCPVNTLRIDTQAPQVRTKRNLYSEEKGARFPAESIPKS